MDSLAARESQVGGDSSAARLGAGMEDLPCRRSVGRVPVAGKRRARTPRVRGRGHWPRASRRGSDGLLPESARTATARSFPWLARPPGTPDPDRWPTSGPLRSWQLDSRKSAIRLGIGQEPLGAGATSVTERPFETARASAVPRPAAATGCRGGQPHPSTAHARSRRSIGRTEEIDANRTQTPRQ